MKIFNDPLYGQIQIENWQFKLLNLPEISKYRNIKMTGLLYITFPSANHTRFENILGTLHLCNILRKTYEKQLESTEISNKNEYEKVNINDYDWFILQFASILYHLQNFCFSQSFIDTLEYLDFEYRKEFFLQKQGIKEYLFEKVKDFFNENNDYLKNLIKNELGYDVTIYNKCKESIKEIFKVNQKENKDHKNKNQNDPIDKMSLLIKEIFPLNRLDYYARDAYYTNGLKSYDTIKILKGFKGLYKRRDSNNLKDFYIVFNRDVKSELEKFFFQRLYMYHNYYSNPLSRRNECVFKNFFKYATENYSNFFKKLVKKSKDKTGLDDFFLKFMIHNLKENNKSIFEDSVYRL